MIAKAQNAWIQQQDTGTQALNQASSKKCKTWI
jgi:hypothetical protein